MVELWGGSGEIGGFVGFGYGVGGVVVFGV